MNKEEIKRNLENYILQTSDKKYLTFETNTNLMARDCLNTIEQLISQLDIANKKIDEIENKIKCLGKFDGEQCTRSFKMWTADFNELLSIIGDKQ